MRLLHYSAEPFTFNPEHVYSAESRTFKPHGLWVSVEGEDDWPHWCEDEQWGLPGLTHCAEVVLKPDAKVLVIDTLPKMDAFHELYRRTDDNLEIRNINWHAVTYNHDGLIIAPYRWDRRLELMWYYGWDCASGVIWNLRAVDAVRPIPSPGGDKCE